jgi:PAT family beta-lactamase induction signal transducer AmpG
VTSGGGAPPLAHPARHVHPWAFMVLIVPFGVNAGYLTVAIAYQLKHAGVAVGGVAAIIALSYIPHVWKFLWAPIADSTLDQKRWYLLANLASAIGLAALGAFPVTRAGLTSLTVAVVLSSWATTFVGMATESLMAYSTPEHLKGRASGWFQAGNLGGTGLGGGFGLWLIQRVPHPAIASGVVGALCVACCLALLAVPTPERSHGAGGLGHELLAVVRDLWHIVRERSGALALFLCFLPIGSGAASGLWSAVADEWRTSGDTVALVTGVLAGVISAVGCVAGGWICDRMDRKAAYVGYGLLQAACAVAMAVFPRTSTMFVLWTSVYAFITGLTYAGYSAFVLEAIGKGAAATKFSVYASLSNFPIMYMTTIDGKAHDRWGSTRMLFTEAGLCVAGALVFVTIAAMFGWRMSQKPGADAPEPVT